MLKDKRKNVRKWEHKKKMRQAAVLGMNPSTARHRLKTNLLWFLWKLYSGPECFRCGEVMTDSCEKHLDHAIAWMGLEDDEDKAAAFWDVGNLRYSHAKCNVHHGKTVQNERNNIQEINKRKKKRRGEES